MKMRTKQNFGLSKQREEEIGSTMQSFFDNQKLYLKSGLHYTKKKEHKNGAGTEHARDVDVTSDGTFHTH